MPFTGNVGLSTPGECECTVDPVVMFSIVDHYSRRDEGQTRVIGTLLGTVVDNKVEVTASFPVPHTETDEQVAVNTDFHATMLQLHQRVHKRDRVVGWYSTGEEINDSSLLFHEFYGQAVERPVHLLLDLGLGARCMGCKAYTSKALTLGGRQLGTLFQDAKLRVSGEGEGDRIGLDTLHKNLGGAGGEARLTGAVQEADSMEVTVKKLLRTLEGVAEYVGKLKGGSATADPEVVALLQDVMTAAPRLPAATFDKMYSSQMQDMLVVVYLANLTRAQLALSEKLQAVAAS